MKFSEYLINESKNYPDDIELVKKYLKAPDSDNIFYHYTGFNSLDKFGIKPSNDDFVNGIYCYNVKDVGFHDIWYPKKKGFVYFFKMKNPNAKLDLQSYNNSEFKKDIKKLNELGIKITEDMIQKYISDTSDWDEPIKEFFEKHGMDRPARIFIGILHEYYNSSNGVNIALQKLGYEYIIDHGDGLFTDGQEAAQAVLLSPKYANIIEKGIYHDYNEVEKRDAEREVLNRKRMRS